MSTAAPPREAFRLVETLSLSEGVIAEDGTVPITIIRPTLGRGKGRHLYTADMLRENAHKFTGWRMYIDHQSEEARRKARGLPRGVRELAGRIVEAEWDPSVPAEGSFGQGAVVGRARPVRFVRELIEDDPELLEASINARATSVRPTTVEGQSAWLVEGIERKGTVDVVTEGGAGGRIGDLLEAVYNEDDAEEMAVLDTLTDQELVAKLRKERPELIEALVVEQPGKQGKQEPEAKPEPEVKEPPKVDAQAVLREALQTDEGKTFLRESVTEAMSGERELIRAEARADADRVIQLHSMERDAHRMIEAARLPERWDSQLKGRYSLTEGGPARDLDIVDEIDEESLKVKRPAEELLRESVQAAVTEARELIAASGGGARVSGQGPVTEGKGGEAKSSYWGEVLQEAGFEDPNEVYDLKD